MATTTTTETIEKRTVTLNAHDILYYMGLPKNAYDIRLYIKIPGGGDYSNMDLDVTNDREACVEVRYSLKSIPID